MEQISEHVKFKVNYSMYLAEMTEIFNRRINQFLTFLQILLGASVFGNIQYGWLLGFFISSISAIQLTIKFGEIAGNSKSQVRIYRMLANELCKLSEDQINSKINEIEKNNSRTLISLYKLAKKRTSIALYGIDKEDDNTLTRWEQIVYFISGGVTK
ncbi:MAG: hypothetical protein ACEY29_02370 [Arsenophonus sp.]